MPATGATSAANAAMATVAIDAAEIRRALSLFLPAGQVTELRVLDGTLAGERWSGTLSGYFDDAAKLIAALSSVRSAKGVYIVANPVEPALLARAANRLKRVGKGETTSDSDIIGRRWLLIDCDPRRPSGVSATDAEHDAAIERWRDIYAALRHEYGWPDPVAADSGNGGHLLYRIDQATDDGGLVQRCLAALAARFDDDAVTIDTMVYNASRIWKLYGTRACKGDNTRDRPHRMARLLSVPEPLCVVTRKQLEALAADAPEQTQPIRQSSNRQPFDIDGFIARHGFEVDDPEPWQGGRRWVFRRSPLCDHHDGAAFIAQHASGALIAKCHHNSCRWTWHDLRSRFEPRESRPAAKRRRDESPRETGRVPAMIRVADVEPQPVEWLWPGRIALGKVTLFAGDPGLGKSLLTLDIAARVSRGAPWPDAPNVWQPAGSVVVLSAEDDLADTIRPRLDAHNADCEKTVALTAVRGTDDDGPYIRPFDLARDIDQLRAAIDEATGCRLVVIDPVSAYLGKSDSHVNAEVRAVLAPLAELAAEKRVAVVCVTHLRKGEGAAMYRAMGSLAFVAAARAVWAVARDKNDSKRRLMLAVKNNLAADGAATGLAYAVECHGPGGAPVVCWSADNVTMTADEALAPEHRKRGPAAGERDEAERWLCAALADGPRPAKELTNEALHGQCLCKRTLDRARKAIGVIAFRPENPGPWYWRMPAGADGQLGNDAACDKQRGNLGNVPRNPTFSGDSAEQNATLPSSFEARSETSGNGRTLAGEVEWL